MAARPVLLEGIEGGSPSDTARWLRESFPDVLFGLRRPGALCATLPLSSWALLVAVLARVAREDSPVPLTLAELSGLSERAVRKHLNLLRDAELVDPPHRRSALCRPGRALRAELRRLAREPARHAEAAPYADPAPDADSDASADAARSFAMDLAASVARGAASDALKNKKNKLTYFPFNQSSPLAQSSTDPVADIEVEMAREALSALYLRRHPSGPVLPSFPQDEIALVVRCTRACVGDADTKRAMHHYALRGALAVSRGGPPTPRFVWGRMEHFLAHVARGRAELARSSAARTRPAPEASPPVPLQASREAWAKLGEILESSALASGRAQKTPNAQFADENKKATAGQK